MITDVLLRKKESPTKTGRKPPVGHEVILASSAKKRTTIEFVMMDNEVITGKISQYDRYTITIWETGKTAPTTFFKHAIKLFRPIYD